MAEDEVEYHGIDMLASHGVANSVALSLLFKEIEKLAPGATEAVADRLREIADRDDAGIPARPAAFRDLADMLGKGW